MQVLVEELHTCHWERYNSSITSKTSLNVGEIVKANIHAQSNIKSGKLKKHSYQVRGPLFITKDINQNAFEIEPYNQPDGATQKYKATELYLLPPA